MQGELMKEELMKEELMQGGLMKGVEPIQSKPILVCRGCGAHVTQQRPGRGLRICPGYRGLRICPGCGSALTESPPGVDVESDVRERLYGRASVRSSSSASMRG